MGTIRPATLADYAAFVVLERELGMDEPPTSAERWEQRFVPGTLVYETDAGVLAFVNYYELAQRGYVRMLAVRPELRRGGIATALMRAVAERLRAQGITEWQLHVKADNAPAIALYERLGMRRLHLMTLVRMTWQLVASLPAVDAEVREIAPGDDAALERAFDLAPGQLGMMRARPGCVMRQLRDAQGVTCFLPSTSGAAPFRVVRPELASALLQAMQPHAVSEVVQLGIDDDEALVALLMSSGGELRSRTYHYAGTI